MDEVDCVDKASLSAEALWKGPRGELHHWGRWKIC